MEKRRKRRVKSVKSATLRISKKLEEITENPKRPNDVDRQVMMFLGKMWNRWPPRLEVKKDCRQRVKVGKYINGNDKLLYMYKCAHCGELSLKIDVDHIDPVISPSTGFITLDEWVKRKFVSKEHLQPLCSSCHKIKSAKENVIRAKVRKDKLCT